MSTNFVTPIGNVQYAWIKNEEIIHKSDGSVESTGKYSITVGFTEEETQQFITEINKVWEEFLNEKLQNKEFNLAKHSMPIREINGKTYFVFRKNTIAKTKDDGQPVKLYVPIFDSDNKNCTNKVAGLGRDSQVKVSFSYYPFYMSANTYGVSLRLHAIQLIKLVPITSDGGKYGFDTVANGFVAQATEDEFEIPY